ncbi:hypothetical protein FACS189450_03890 [Spirochaetia bacterium]|nr:hypothetical protein FACS189450_03890 [Spirochaetia bacterium]
MKSSEAAQTAASNPLYGILAVFIPWSVLCTGVPLIGRIITHALPGIAFPYISIFAAAFFCSITVSIYAGMMKNLPGDHSAANIRGAIIIVAAAYVFASFLRFDLALGRRFLPGLANFLGMLASFYVWVFVLYLREIFKAREFFESHTRQYEGENLQRIMLEDAALMGDADANLRKLITVYGVQLGIVGVLAIVSGILKISLSLTFRILLVILYVSAACIFAILELFKREQYFAGEGIAMGGPERSKRITAILCFSVSAAAAALLFAADNNILPISIITGFLAWLASLLARPPRPYTAENFALESTMPGGEPMPDMQQLLGLEPAEPWPFWDYVKYAAIALLILGFIWFMIKPLLSRSVDSGKIPFRLKLARLILQWFSALRQGLDYFFSALRKDNGSYKMNRPGAEKIKGMAADLLAAYSQAKKRDMKNSLTLFARLILWGTETLNVPWKPSRAPGEYCAALVQALAAAEAASNVTEAAGPEAVSNTAETGAAIIRCGELFEEALYGAEVLSKEKQREFKALVEKAVG